MIAKHHAYRFKKTSTEYSEDYWSHQKQKIKANTTFSNWKNKLLGVSHGFMLGPLLFNVFLCDLFLFITNTNLVSYANVNAPFAIGSSKLEVVYEIQSAREKRFLRVQDKCMKLNLDKFHLLRSDTKDH